ncbi:hypothetical protein M406DRAFT_347425 [Cryphonectria parasitica EP155]|uniref:DUF7514 domain-containing protein n=1 Tax=Cryphonectria parasitica (strain ATCC 38755 / EP155) TaxID=660469 RepID=A0A9P4XWG3_CRYP1|nr:uncharacterized protein M406DRAFT_347425 [Cryphonectria parasitica EP155]KAF3762268.1 hypothetical protein M406DRAFT_347425 [Cryphonectria parasitica EP155]
MPPPRGGGGSSSSSNYYGYLFEPNKTPTKVLDALLRAIGQYIIDHVGEENDRVLKPSKLAAFYKAVGGDYDKLFLNAPHESISYIWQVFGCRHTLEPTENDYEQPSVPALTLKGFVRWESIQILLTPDEDVPLILAAVRKWDLKNPDTGEPFPKDLSALSFPSEPDPDITAWHAACGEKLREMATPKEEQSSTSSPRPAFAPAADRVNAGFSHVPAGSRGATDYFSHRSVPFSHVSPGDTGRYPRGGGGARVRIDPDIPERMRHGGLSPDERARRRSFSDYPSPHEPHSSAHLNPPRPSAARWHSHPRRPSTDDSDLDDDISPRTGRRSSEQHRTLPHRSPKIIPRYVAVPATGPPDGGAKLRTGDYNLGARRKSAGFDRAKDWASEKLSGIFPLASPMERPSRKSPGSSSGNVAAGGASSRDSLRLGRRSHDEDEGETDSGQEREQRHRRARDRRRREREYERDRDRDREQQHQQPRAARRGRDDLPDWEDAVRDRPRSRRDGKQEARYPHRPDINPRRTSSHADVDRLDRDRQRYEMDPRDRYPDERRRRGGPLDERPSDRTASPGIKGVGGRRYPAETPWTQDSPPL